MEIRQIARNKKGVNMKERYVFLEDTNQIHDVKDNYLYAFNNLEELTEKLNQQDKHIKELESKLKRIEEINLYNKDLANSSIKDNLYLMQVNQRLRKSQKQLAIDALEKVKFLLEKENKKNPIIYDINNDFVDAAIDKHTCFCIIDNQIKNLKE